MVDLILALMDHLLDIKVVLLAKLKHLVAVNGQKKLN
jgi:hypothetical protein